MKRPILPWALLSGLLATACGTILDSGSQGSQGDGECVRSSPLRRLSHTEYDNTVRDLLGDDSRPSASFPADTLIYNFENNVLGMTVNPALAEKLLLGAEALSERATENLDQLLSCDPSSSEDDCVRAFIASFGRRAFRRPLSPEEATSLYATYSAGRNAGDLREGIKWVIQRVLQSPDFLYRVEAVEGDEPRKANPFELASRLSYFLWSSMPDEELLADAESGRLNSPDDVARHARRMLSDPRARGMVARFHDQWLELGSLSGMVKDPGLYPGYDQDLADRMRAQVQRFVEHVIWDLSGNLPTLLTATFTFADERLAPLYGVTGISGAELQRIELDGEQRAGLLTHAGILSLTAKADQSSPVRRGVYIREQLLCDSLPPPPPNVQQALQPPGPNLTTRERYEEHTANPACSGCHSLIDPIGFALENYDALGQWRTEENGRPIDSSGDLPETDAAGGLVGAVELATRLAASDQVSRCVTTQWFRFAYGRSETAADECTISELHDRFASSDLSIQELLVAITQTEEFLTVTPGGP